MSAPTWLHDDVPLKHKCVRLILFLTSFSWTLNPIQDYMDGGTPIEKLVTRMIPMLVVALYAATCPYRARIKTLLKPAVWPILWYVTFGVFCGFSGVQPALCAWKGAEIIILLMYVAVTCRDHDSTCREFIAMTRLVEILLWVTVVLAFLNPALGLRRSASILPWLQGYFPIINPNALGFLSLAALSRLIFLPAKAKPIRLALSFATLLCAQSRTSYALCVVILFLFILDGLREKMFLRTAAAAFGSGLFLLLAFGHQDTFLQIITRGQDAETIGSMSGRTDYWQFALQYTDWLGKGLATGSRTLIFITGQDTFHHSTVNVHNSYVEALLGAGYIGAAPYIAAVAINTGKQFFRTLSQPSVSNAIFLVMAVVFIARSMTSVVIAVFSYDLMMLMICWAALQYHQQRIPHQPPLPAATPVVYDVVRSKQ